MPTLTKIADWAASMNISRQQGYQAIKRCDIPVTDGKVDPAIAKVLYERGTRARAGKPDPMDAAGKKNASSAGASEYATQRARREEAEASIAEVKLAEMMGLYLLKADVADAVFGLARAMRDGLTNCARRIAADVAGETDAGACEVIIEREHRALLQSMTAGITQSLAVRAASPEVTDE